MAISLKELLEPREKHFSYELERITHFPTLIELGEQRYYRSSLILEGEYPDTWQTGSGEPSESPADWMGGGSDYTPKYGYNHKYNAPYVDVFSFESKTTQNARKLFYDFYAMDYLHRQFGPSGMTTGAKMKAATMDPNWAPGTLAGANWDEVEYPLSQKILPKKFIDVIEEVYEQVTKQISDKLLTYLRMALIQELRHMMTNSNGWSGFRQALVTHYNSKGNITSDEFKRIVDKHIPLMKTEIPSVMRLLKFSKYLSSGMTTKDNNDTFDVARKTVQVPGKPLYVEPGDEPEVAPEVEPEEPTKSPEDEIPDDSVHSIEPIDDPFADEPTGGTPSSKDPSYSPEDWYWDPSLKTKTHSSPPEKKKKINELNVPEISKVRRAINKSGLTWQDVDNAYNKINWGGAFGGPKWGTGSSAFLKLVPKRKEMNVDDMAYLVDHIFDLEHNTGGLLNKGGMNMKDEDLDRRAKTTHVARYLPYVSEGIKKIILMFLKYLPGDPEVQKNIDAYLNAPTKDFTPEEDAALKNLKFYDVGDQRRANIRFFSKKKDHNGNPNEVSGRFYDAKVHTNGKYTLVDTLRSDAQVFDKFEDMLKYIDTFKSDIKGGAGVASPAQISAKQKYLDTHERIKLPADKETILLEACKMGWRPDKKDYKAYLDSDNGRLYLYAFGDGTFLVATKPGDTHKIFGSWPEVLEYVTKQTANALPYPKYDEAKTYIGQPFGGVKSSFPKVSGTVLPPPPPPKKPLSSITPLAHATPSSTALLPPNSLSKAAYSMHVGISKPPTKTIRLTKEDEAIVLAAGFNGKMIGSDMCYIHKTVGDVVKFYPNDTARLTFLNKSSGVPSITFNITKMLTWIHEKYSVSMTASPIKTGVSKPTSPTVGIQAGSLFEKTISNAGFEWDAAAGQYIDKKYNGKNTLFIKPDRSSILTIKPNATFNDEPHYFKNLPDLLAYLKTDYPVEAQKKTKSITIGSKLIDEKLKELGFILASGAPPTDIWINQGNSDIKGAIIEIRNDETSSYVSPSGKIKYSFKTLIELGNYLTQLKTSSSAIPVSQEKEPKFSPWFTSKQSELMEKAGYKYTGPVGDEGESYTNGSDKIIVYPGNIFKVYDAAHDNWIHYTNSDELTEYLYEKYGSMGFKTPTAKQDGITPQEENDIKEVVGKYGQEYWTEYVKASEIPGGFGQSSYVEIFKKSSSQEPTKLIYSIGALGNYYQVNDSNNTPIKNFLEFAMVLEWLDYELKTAALTPYNPDNEYLTPTEMKQVVTLVNSHPGWKGNPNTNNIYVTIHTTFPESLVYAIDKANGKYRLFTYLITTAGATLLYDDDNLGLLLDKLEQLINEDGEGGTPSTPTEPPTGVSPDIKNKLAKYGFKPI